MERKGLRILAALLLTLVVAVPAWSQDEGENGGDAAAGKRRGQMGERMKERRGGQRGGRQRPGQGPLAWFLELDAVKAERETHRANVEAIRKEVPELIKTTVEAARQDGGEVDREAIQQQVEAKLPDVAGRMIDEFARHHRALADLLEANKAAGTEKLIETVKKLHEDRKGGPGDGKRPRGGPDADEGNGQGPADGGGDFEGAVF
ncbi:MAG: hypothetical protein ACOCX4_04850 [Planctomycetota bacterium]